MTATHTEHPAAARPPLWRDATVIKWTAQIGLLAVTLAALAFLVSQAGDNLNTRGIKTGFDFLSNPPGIQLSEGIDTKPDTGARALWVGMVNTLRISVAGIVFATILGTIIGIARLSRNWIVAKVATVYVETIRNVPLLVQIIFFFAVVGALPNLTTETGPLPDWLYISNKGIALPRVFPVDGFFQWAAFMLIGAVVARVVYRRRNARHDATGEVTYPVLSAVATLVAFAVVGWFAHPLVGFLGPIFGALADLVSSIPQIVLQIVLVAVALGAAARWIRTFWRSFDSPAGRARLTDDDWFRIIFAGVLGVLASGVVVLWPGLSSWLLNSTHDLLRLLEGRFSFGDWSRPWDAMQPVIEVPGRFPRYGPQGLTLRPAFAAVFLGVVLYTAAFIAEIVRGGILAVPKGQLEAAAAVGLTRAQSLRHIVLPQAFRIILPPVGNQYLNLTKNTTLAIAVGYSDLVQVGQTLYNQTGRTLEVVGIWMLFYLAVSLGLSAIVNFWNVRLKLVER